MSDTADLTTLSRRELEEYCASLRETSLRYGEQLNKLQTENGKLRAEVKSLRAST